LEEHMNKISLSLGAPLSFFLCSFVLLAGCVDPQAEEVGASGEALSRGPVVPPALAVSAGNMLAFQRSARGVQIYACTAGASGPSWVFQAPEATLYDRHQHFAGTHFAGPTWRDKDGSEVVGAKVAAVTVDPSAIPWLLLGAKSHAGQGRMEAVTFVQRISTTGGIAPQGGCDDAHVGAVARVDYTAEYVFYRGQCQYCEATEANDE
jgi:hypothetical protein